jgi:flagellar hook-associated protein 1 FlgK
MSINAGYNILSQALDAFQTELNTVGNNVANVNTPGYTRETVNLEENPSTGYGAYQVGGGVTVAGIQAIQNQLLNQSMNSAQSGNGMYSSLTSALQGAQQAFPEPSSSGISESLSGFFNSLSGLAASPNSSSAQLAVQQAAQTLTGAVQSAYSQLQQTTASTTTQIGQTIGQVNQLTGQIASLNKQIASEDGSNPNSLVDQRNQDVQTLSGLIDISTSTNSNGTMNVYSNGLNLVDEGGSTAMPSNYTAGSLTFSDSTNSVTIQGGQLAGEVQALGKLNSYTSQLNTLANNLTSQVNALYKTGKTTTGTTGQDFFATTNPPAGAAGFQLSASILASPGNIASGTTGKAGDGALAQSLSDLSTATISGLGSSTFGTYYSNLVGQVGTDVQNATNSGSTQSALVTQITAQQQSVSGVNLDEEMSNMLQYQESYETAAKALSTIDATAEDLIQTIQ